MFLAPRPSVPARVVGSMMKAVQRLAPGLAPGFQRWFIRFGYTLISTAVIRKREDLTFMNYGYASLDGERSATPLQPEDRGKRSDFYATELYRRVAGARDLRGKDVLEVGSGRGGGSSFIARSLGPRSVTGVDFAAASVAFCRRRHQVAGLTFLEGNAEDLPFAPASFDVVVNVESSHCYPSFERFVREVARVLRPGGELLFADLRPRAQIAVIREQLAQVFTIVEEERITPNVFRALELYSERRKAEIRERVPAILRRAVRNFAAVEGTAVFEAMRRGELDYFRFVLRRSEQP